MKRWILITLLLTLMLSGCQQQTSAQPTAKATAIQLSDSSITVDGKPISRSVTDAIYAGNDIVYYPTGKDFTFGEGTEADAHAPSEADRHTVVHITKPGTYSLTGSLSAGQIAVDLGKDAKNDPNAVVTLILDNANITCSVAPAVIFYNVYECGDKDNPTRDVDTSKAGAKVYLADGSENYISGSYVARIYKPDSVELSKDGTSVEDAKKLHKYDAAFYSKMSMNIDGSDGILHIEAENEGLDSELHLTLNGGDIRINSGNDGINTNEDGVSVTTINGGHLRISVNGSTGEGDGIDSNGWLVVNGGTVEAYACGFSADSGIDSDLGIHINGGTVIAGGNMLDEIAESSQTYAVFQFAQAQSGGTVCQLRKEDGSVALECVPENAFTYLIVVSDQLAPGDYRLWCNETPMVGAIGMQMGGMGMPPGMNGHPGPQFPEGEIPDFPDGEAPAFPEGEMHPIPGGQAPQMPEGMAPPNGFPGGPAFDQIPSGELSEIFKIQQGANHFSAVKPSI